MTQPLRSSMLRRPMLKLSKISLFSLLLLVAMPYSYAQDDEPLRPEDAYLYVVSDTGDAIEVDWAIEDGYYLYRNDLSFETTTDGVIKKKIRYCFFSANQAKMVNCVSASATAQHIEASIKWKL